MNFDQLQQLWNTTENPKSALSINKEIINEFTAIKLQDGLKEIKWSAIIEIVITSLWLIFLLGFIVDHVLDYNFLIPAIILTFLALMSIVLESYKLHLYLSIKNQFSIINAQRRIERLNFLELLDINSLHLIIPLFFVPFVIVFAKGFLGIDVFNLGLGFSGILLATLGSAVVAVVVAYFLKKFPIQEMRESIIFLREISDLKKG